MNPANIKPIRILLIEDNPGDARLLQEMLADAKDRRFDLECADRLSTGLERLANSGADVVLLDLGLSESQGLETLSRVRAQAPKTPIVVMTGLGDETTAVKAVQEGAQDYLVKGEIDTRLLARSIRHAIERNRLMVELERAQEREKHNSELLSLERLSRQNVTSVTAELYGDAPLRQTVPDVFAEFVRRYEDLMDLTLEQRAFKVQHNVSEKLRVMAEEMGFVRAGPRDVVEIHTRALREKCNEATQAKSVAYSEEGRLIALELMGYLAAFYRRYASGVHTTFPSKAMAVSINKPSVKESHNEQDRTEALCHRSDAEV